MAPKCRNCYTADRAPGAYKYCKECKVLVAKELNVTNQQIRRQRNYTLCERCNIEMSYTKYCKSCAPRVKHEQRIARRIKIDIDKRKEIEHLKKMCERCGVNEKWSTNGTTKYCDGCKSTVQREKILKKNRIRDEAKKRINKPRKQPIHKGIKLDPTAQAPTKKAPKILKEDGGVNPYFLRRGNPAKNGNSSGFTQFNQ